MSGRLLVIDSFAGGGGASTGIEMALAALAAQGLLPGGCSGVVDVAINHDDAALAMHEANHPRTRHLPHDVWKVGMHDIVRDDAVGLLWSSPDCRHHSRAKGGAPVSSSIRDLADVIVKWVGELEPHQRPQNIFVENVPEFRFWSPTIPDGKGGERPDRSRRGESFDAWIEALRALGYRYIEWREIHACDFGVPTIRKRLYVVLSREREIVWPAATHGRPGSAAVRAGLLKPWPVNAQIIEWDRDCPSILMNRAQARSYCKRTGKRLIRPLARNTMARIAKGVKRYVLDAERPFIVTCDHGEFRGVVEPDATVARSRDAHGIVVPHMMTMRNSDKPHAAMGEPSHTVTAGGAGLSIVEAALTPLKAPAGATRRVEAGTPTLAVFMAQHNNHGGQRGGNPGQPVDRPMSTLTGSGSHQGVVAAHMLSLKGSDRRAADCMEPHAAICAGGQHSAVVSMPLVPAVTHDGLLDPAAVLTPAMLRRARRVADFLREFGCWDEREFVVVNDNVITDIGMRMLVPRELARAQGFPDDYVLAAPHNGSTLTDTEQRHKIGNSVCPQVAAALVEANYRPSMPAASRKPRRDGDALEGLARAA